MTVTSPVGTAGSWSGTSSQLCRARKPRSTSTASRRASTSGVTISKPGLSLDVAVPQDDLLAGVVPPGDGRPCASRAGRRRRAADRRSRSSGAGGAARFVRVTVVASLPFVQAMQLPATELHTDPGEYEDHQRGGDPADVHQTTHVSNLSHALNDRPPRRHVRWGRDSDPGSDDPGRDATGLADRYGRIATDLRVSLTDRCNLRCTYCMPEEGLDWLAKPELLTDDEVVRLVSVAVTHLGVARDPLHRRRTAAPARPGRHRRPYDGTRRPAPRCR